MKLLYLLTSCFILITSSVSAQSSFPLTQPGLYKHITTSTTTLVKTGVGVLKAVCINTKGASSNTATVYDGVDNTGSVIAVLDTTVTFGCQNYNVGVTTGITVVTATGTAGDLTVSFQ